MGGRTVAPRTGTSPRYLVSDHLGSTHGELGTSGAELGQRRYRPFGTDRAVAGAPDLVADERFTGQNRLESGGGSPAREVYDYGARAYLPGIGVFLQPDTLVPDPKNPQSLNRYAYTLNNPLMYVDPTGHSPEWFNAQWLEEFRENNGRAPTVNDYAWRYYTMARASGLLPAEYQTYPTWFEVGIDPSGPIDLDANLAYARQLGENASRPGPDQAE